MYLPSSHKVDLLLNGQLESFESDVISIYNLDKEPGQTTQGYQRFFNFKVAVKKLKLRDNLHGQYTRWAEEFTHDEQFDYIVQTNTSHTGIQLFKQLNLTLDPFEDMLLVKIDGIFDSRYAGEVTHASLKMNFQMSSSDITYLPPSVNIRSVVSDDPNKYKIFEFYVNEM